MNKISLKGLKDVLSDKELKEVMAGSGNGCNAQSESCNTSKSCQEGQFHGKCGWVELQGRNYCACK